MKALTRLSVMWPTIARDVSGLLGAGMISLGVSEIYRPAGLIVAGAMLLAAAFLSARATA